MTTMMDREACFRALARHVTDEIVVASYSSAFEWLKLGERPLNYFSVGAMGLDSSHGLGNTNRFPATNALAFRS